MVGFQRLVNTGFFVVFPRPKPMWLTPEALSSKDAMVLTPESKHPCSSFVHLIYAISITNKKFTVMNLKYGVQEPFVFLLRLFLYIIETDGGVHFQNLHCPHFDLVQLPRP